MPWNSYFEIGGIILDGTTKYHHPSGRRIKRGLTSGNADLVAIGTSELITRNLSEKEGVPYSDFQMELRGKIQRHRRTVRRVIAAAPLSAPVGVGALLALTAAEMWTYAVGSYDMYTPNTTLRRKYDHWTYDFESDLMSNIDTEELCPECNTVAILDGEARICYECWNNLVIAEAEEE